MKRLLALLVLGLTVALIAPADAASPKQITYGQQRQFLDPEAFTEGDPVPAAPRPHHLHPDHHRTASGTGGVETSAVGSQAAPASTDVGTWSVATPFPTRFNAAHTIAGPHGKVLLVAGSGNSRKDFAAGTFRSFLWDTNTDARREIPTPVDLFCAGHVLLPDGRALVVGGTGQYSDASTNQPFTGASFSYAFNFATETYEQLPPMSVARWYPTPTKLPNGKVVITGGLDGTGRLGNVTEVFDPATNAISRTPALRTWPNYPHIVVSPRDGRLLFTGGRTSGGGVAGPGFWHHRTNSFTAVPGMRRWTQRRNSASCFVGDVQGGRVMVLAGGWPATNITDVVDLRAATPRFVPGPPLPAAKGYVGCVNLPDGALLEANGGTSNVPTAASLTTSLLQPGATAWKPVTPMPAGTHRLYHSQLFLLDDGRVVSITSNPEGPRDESVLVFSPPYLFTGERPTITTAPPTEVGYGRSYPAVATQGAVVWRLLSPPAPTHSSDVNQRSVRVAYNAGMVMMPLSRNEAPPGWYRLYAVDPGGRPSVASWVHLT